MDVLLENQDFVYSSDNDEGDNFLSEINLRGDDYVSYKCSDYEILSWEKVHSYIGTITSTLEGLFEIPHTCIRALLADLKWDEEKLVDLYFSEARKKLLAKNKLEYLFDDNFKNNAGCSKSKDENPKLCQICFNAEEKDVIFANACGHCFCFDCWKRYIALKLDVGLPESSLIRCPMYDCDVVVDDEIIINLCAGSNMLKRFKTMLCRNYVNHNPFIKMCPNSSCDYFIKAGQLKARKVVCVCGHSFCFKCVGFAHEPVECELLKLWNDKKDSYRQDIDWLRLNSKQCPKCHANISKDGGCNQVKCISNGCNHVFCWVCLKPWVTHESNDAYKCNQYEARRSLVDYDTERWKFFFHRYSNHNKSLSVSRSYLSDITAYFAKIMGQVLTNEQSRIIQRLTDQLIECRETLMYSYIFSCAVVENNQVGIFLSNQRNLEVILERIASFIEFEMYSKKASFDFTYQFLSDRVSLCEKRRQILISIVDEGHSKNYWVFEKDWSTKLQ